MANVKVLNVCAIKVTHWIPAENFAFQFVHPIVVKVIVRRRTCAPVTMVSNWAAMDRDIAFQNAQKVVSLVNAQPQKCAHAGPVINCSKKNAFQYANGRSFKFRWFLIKTDVWCDMLFFCRGCLHGRCVGPDQCACEAGWTLDASGVRCEAKCDQPCLNGMEKLHTARGKTPFTQCSLLIFWYLSFAGACSGPNVCSCNPGYQTDPINSFK